MTKDIPYTLARNALLASTIFSLSIVPVAASIGRVTVLQVPALTVGIAPETPRGDIYEIDCDDNDNESNVGNDSDSDTGPGDGDGQDGGGEGDGETGEGETGGGEAGEGGLDSGGLISFDGMDLDFKTDRLLIREAFKPSADVLVHRIGCDDDRRRAQFGKTAARKTVRLVQSTEDYCRFIPKAYLIDCIAAKYERVARSLPNSGENAQVRQAFTTAAAKLRSIVRQTQDDAVRPARPRVQNQRAPRRLTPVKPERQAAAVATAQKVIVELETTLLRSAENSDRRKVYFTQVAQAVDSNKVLLRS